MKFTDIVSKRGKVFRTTIKVSLGKQTMKIPLIAFTGTKIGKTLYIQAAQHAEYQGTGAIERLLERLDPERLRGNLIFVPIADTILAHQWPRIVNANNPFTVENMNERWPGKESGDLKERAVFHLFQDWVKYADAFIDLHCWYGASVPSALVSGKDAFSIELAKASGYPFISITERKPKRRPWSKKALSTFLQLPLEGIPGFCIEANHDWKFGGYLTRTAMDLVERSLRNTMKVLGIMKGKPVYPSQRYTLEDAEERPLAKREGLLIPDVPLGTLLKKGERFARIFDVERFQPVDELRTRKGGLYFGTFPRSIVRKGDWTAVIKTEVKRIRS